MTDGSFTKEPEGHFLFPASTTLHRPLSISLSFSLSLRKFAWYCRPFWALFFIAAFFVAHIPRVSPPVARPPRPGDTPRHTALHFTYSSSVNMDYSEKATMKMDYSPHGSGLGSPDDVELPEYGEHVAQKPKWTTRVVDSFKRDPNAHATPKAVVGADGRVFDVDSAAHGTASSPLSRTLKGRHLQMIAIGGSIGTGLFVGSGSALATGGPASLIIAFALIGIMMYTTVHALGEMAVLFPVSGSFSAYSTRFIDPAWGFAMGWK